jgi:hypothetical protein
MTSLGDECNRCNLRKPNKTLVMESRGSFAAGCADWWRRGRMARRTTWIQGGLVHGWGDLWLAYTRLSYDRVENGSGNALRTRTPLRAWVLFPAIPFSVSLTQSRWWICALTGAARGEWRRCMRASDLSVSLGNRHNARFECECAVPALGAYVHSYKCLPHSPLIQRSNSVSQKI